ncbi:MAG: aminoglycoside phosphotransferase family protein [Actinobacteria bacterium]|nr:aminoglycoside phosphotransferase family protein [Actinomycetota bacterium]
MNLGPPGEEEIVLGDPPSAVVRVGDTVRRPVEPSTPAVHALLRHLEDVGFNGSPGVLGIDEWGREVLTYLTTEPGWPYAEKALVGAARLVRSLQVSLEGFTPPPDAVWSLARPSASAAGFGHNDVRPANAVYAAGVPYAFIDWELAGPSPPLYDVAWAAINFVPLRPDRFCLMVGFPAPPDRGERLRLFCDAYGLGDRLRLLDTVEAYEREGLKEIVELGGAGLPPFDRFLARGEDRFLRWDLEWFLAHRTELEAALQ